MSEKSKNLFKLRPLEAADFDVLAPWFHNINDLAFFDRTSRIPLNSAQMAETWKDAVGAGGKDNKCWFVVESESGEPVGLAGLEGISNVNRDGVFAIIMTQAARRLGVGLRATALLTDFAFRQLGLNRLTSYCRADNKSSLDLVAKVGCEVEGTLRQAWFADGRFHDMVVVGVLGSHWQEHRDTLARQLSDDTVVMFGADVGGGWSWPPQVEDK